MWRPYAGPLKHHTDSSVAMTEATFTTAIMPRAAPANGMTLPFARQLRDSLDRLLLAATPPEGGEQ
jgi:hypothetical protein